MRQTLMAACVLVVLSCGFAHGRPANDNRGSDMLAARAPKPEDFLDYEQRAFSTLSHGNDDSLISPKIRQRRQSDQRRAELETLITLSKTAKNGAKRTNRHLDLRIIGRRRRATVNEIASESASIHRIGKPTEHDGDPTYYPLIS